MRMPSQMSHKFSNVPQANVPRSAFDRKFTHKTTFDAGYLIPFYVDEALPSDTFRMDATLFARLATPIFPIMDNLYMDTFYFAVPYRLIWSNFQKFCGEQVDPGDSTDYTIPQVVSPSGGWACGTLYDYFGLPTDLSIGQTVSVSNLFARAYNLIWNEWFRDQNLQDSVTVDVDDGPDSNSDYVLLRRGKRHDYFTSCLPWPQKGDEIMIPLTGNAPVLGIGKYNQTFPISSRAVYETNGSGTTTYANASEWTWNNDNAKFYAEEDPNNTGYPSIWADMSAVSGATINDLREAFQMQKMLERDARGGTRYTEIIRSHFGAISPDSRLQRPEYLGGDSVPVIVNPIVQTSETNTTPQGTLSGIGTAVSKGQGFTKSFTEHCIIMGLVSVRADLTYQRGIPRMFSRLTREDHYWPSLAHLGEQAVLNKEIYADGLSGDDDVFGYQERWAEYRYYPSKITGQFRSDYATSLDAWHLAEDFASCPVLNSSFITEDPPIDRVIAVASTHFIFDSFMNCRAVRPMPMYGVPGLIDHF